MKSFYDFCIETFKDNSYRGFITSKMSNDKKFPKKERCYMEIMNYFLKQASSDITMKHVKIMYAKYKEVVL